MKFLAVIPARKGSKGVPRKNIALLNGEPLICHTVGPAVDAQKLGVLDRVVVSTDDPDVIRIVTEGFPGVDCIERPSSLATDIAKTIDVVLHVLQSEMANGNSYDAIVLLQPTSPLRELTDIVTACGLFRKHNEACLISTYVEPALSERILYKLNGDVAMPISNGHNLGTRRQEELPIMVRNGAIYITKVHYLMEHKQFMDSTPIAYVMPKDRSINIDRPGDLEAADCLIKQRRKS